MLQLEAEGYTFNIRRPLKWIDPDKLNKFKLNRNRFNNLSEEVKYETKLDTDARFDSLGEKILQKCGCIPTIIDVKAPYDPGASAAQGELVNPLANQIYDIVGKVEFQQQRVQNEFKDEVLLHVINLFYIRPVDRDLFMKTFYELASKRPIDLNRVIFLNENGEAIY